jgi:hypothetical protein
MARAPNARPIGGKRLRRARAWLGAAFFIHGATFVFVLFAIVDGSIRPIAAAFVAGGLAITSWALLLWWERRSPTARRPAHWLRRATMVVLLHAVAFGIAAGSTLDRTSLPAWETVALIACVPLIIELVVVGLASRALRYPLSADLGEMNVEVLVKIRSSERWQPSWIAHDEVRLTDDSIVITVRPDAKFAFVAQIAFVDVVDVGIRRTLPADGPWFVIDGGSMFWPPPGDVVVIRHRHGEQLLPVYEPVGFAEVLRTRVHETTTGENGPSARPTRDRKS